MAKRELVSISQAANSLGVSGHTLQKWIDAEAVEEPSVKSPLGTRMYYTWAQVERIEKQMFGADETVKRKGK